MGGGGVGGPPAGPFSFVGVDEWVDDGRDRLAQLAQPLVEAESGKPADEMGGRVVGVPRPLRLPAGERLTPFGHVEHVHYLDRDCTPREEWRP